MKKILRHYLIDTYSLWAVSNIAQGIVFGEGIKTLLIAGLFLSLTSFFAKPIINILILPINLITFGLFKWVSSAIILYIVTLLVKDFKIESFIFSGFSSKWIDIPALNFQGFLALISYSLLLSVITSFFYWLLK